MDKIEEKCRLICRTVKVDPDGLAPEVFQVKGSKVKNWMLWITTVEASDEPVDDPFDKQNESASETLARIVKETEPSKKPKYSFFTP